MKGWKLELQSDKVWGRRLVLLMEGYSDLQMESWWVMYLATW